MALLAYAHRMHSASLPTVKRCTLAGPFCHWISSFCWTRASHAHEPVLHPPSGEVKSRAENLLRCAYSAARPTVKTHFGHYLDAMTGAVCMAALNTR